MIELGLERDLLQSVYNVALAVRRWIVADEKWRRNANKRHGVSELTPLTTGRCCDASDMIEDRLKGTIRAYCYDGYFDITQGVVYHHTWIVIGSGRKKVILDVTADQFNESIKFQNVRMRPIVYGLPKDLRGYYPMYSSRGRWRLSKGKQ